VIDDRYWELTEEDFKIAEQNGLSRQLVKDRFNKRLWSKQRAITKPKQGTHNSAWSKWKDLSKVDRRAFERRLSKGWDPMKAATTPPTKGKENGIVKQAHIEIAKSNGISRATLMSRVHVYKWDLEEAMTVPPFGKNKIRSKRGKYKKRKSVIPY
jgi:hypothetical protein